MQLEIWSDVVCPWCYIGKARFETAVANLAAEGIDLDLTIVFRPFQLDPSALTDGTSPVFHGYAKKFGGEERAAQILSHVTLVAAESGVTFNMDQALRANTLTAHRILHLALVHHGPETQVRLKQALLQAYFTDGQNIGADDVLIACAVAAGIPSEDAHRYISSNEGDVEVRGDIIRAGELGITAVPTFVFDGKWSIPGAQDVAVFENVLRRLATKSLSS